MIHNFTIFFIFVMFIFKFFFTNTTTLNEDIVDIEKPYEICSLTFVVDKFSRLFLHP